MTVIATWDGLEIDPALLSALGGYGYNVSVTYDGQDQPRFLAYMGAAVNQVAADLTTTGASATSAASSASAASTSASAASTSATNAASSATAAATSATNASSSAAAAAASATSAATQATNASTSATNAASSASSASTSATNAASSATTASTGATTATTQAANASTSATNAASSATAAASSATSAASSATAAAASAASAAGYVVPSQTGNAGKFLTTNGSATSWGAVLTAASAAEAATGTATDKAVTPAALAGWANALTAETSAADADLIPIYDASAAAMRKMTRANLLSGVGGGNTSTFTSSGTVSALTPVAIRSDGKVEAIAGSAGFSVGTAQTVHAAGGNPIGMAYNSTDGSGIIVSQATSGGGGQLYVTAFSVDGTTVALGSAYAVPSASSSTDIACCNAGSNRYVIVWYDNTSTTYAAVVTLSGLVASAGAAVAVNGAARAEYPAVAYSTTSSVFVVTYSDAGNSNRGTAIAGTISGSTITLGTEVVFEAVASYLTSVTWDEVNNKFLVVYNSNSTSCKASVLTATGTSLSAGTPVTVGSILPSAGLHSAYGNGVHVVVCRDYNNSGRATAIAGTISGTSASFGLAVTYASGTIINHQKVCFSIPNNTFFATTNDSSDYLSCTQISNSSTALTAGTNTVLVSTVQAYSWCAFAETVLVCAFKETSSTTRKVVATAVSTTNANSYLGMATTGATNASVTVGLLGYVVTGLSGLTAATDYYVTDAGLLTATVLGSGRYVGRALSSSSLYLRSAP